MFGLEAIATHNGWAISFLGITIVFTGLVLLSLTIGQLHKILNFWDERDTYFQRIKKLSLKEVKPEADIPALSREIKAAAHPYKLLVEKRIGEPFPLPRLLELAEKCGLLRPHSTINDLLQAGLIVPDGKGYFIWKK